jgi:soluble lytic murein transglycosylase-like protein
MSYTEVPNILRHFCFSLGWGLAMAALSAAGQADRPQQIMRVVRADPRTGKLVRIVIVTAKPGGARKAVKPAASAAAPPEARSAGIDEAVERIAATQSLPPQLVHSVIQVESNYNPRAISPKGAQGLMQLMPDTARRFGVANAFDPIDNIRGGARYLKYLLDLYHGDQRLALAAYNAGEGAVQKYGDVPPYPETLNYVTQVGRQIRKDAAAAPPIAKPAAPEAAEVQPAGPAPIREVVGPDGSVRYVSR